MVINFRLELIVAFLSLSLLTGQELAAQSIHESRQQEISKEYSNIAAPLMSDDGTWLTIRKKSQAALGATNDLIKDTILIFNLSDTGKVREIAIRPNIRKISFLGNTHLLMSAAGQTELLNLNDQTNICYKKVKAFETSKGGNKFLLHYNDEEDNRLEIRDCNGNLINSANKISRFYSTENGSVYAIADNGKKRQEICLLKDGILKRIYRTANKIEWLEVDSGEHGVMIYELKPDNATREVLYLDLKTNVCFPLKDVLPVTVYGGSSEVIREGSIYFLCLWLMVKREDTSLVDIWYGTDNKLEEKFYTPLREVYYVWEPGKNSIQRIGTDTLKNNAYIGSERYFLSYDPFLLQDYTRPTPYKMNIYDRLEDRYLLMDTTSGDLYSSPDGQYVIYPKDETWYTYCLSTGEKRAFGNSRLQTPCFTPDGKMILFGGEGGLWIYGRNENKLSRLDVFEGAMVKILNTSEKEIPGASYYDRATFDPGKPLVLELYDDKKNMSTYLLWKNGESDTIIPSTNRYIKHLRYDDEYKHFCYKEEDYNMPPRMVYKTTGKNEEVIYQSNSSDKDILSLKQEIISYTNSDGIALKGVLYYPLHYTSFQKYPMVVHIYQRQYHLANRYPFPSYYDDQGFNIRLLLEKGYFVYMPDILIQGKAGSGKDALDCVNKALDALILNPLIDKDRVGLIGHSFGGYETDFIATHSRRFAAYVSGAGKSDIIWAYHSFNYNFSWPDYMRFEKIIFTMNESFTGDQFLYFENNPLFYADKVNAPVLLWSGQDDKNVTSDQSMAFYNALRRNGKRVVALYYKGEGHTLQAQKARFDLTCRILDWFDYFLKKDKETEWISKGL